MKNRLIEFVKRGIQNVVNNETFNEPYRKGYGQALYSLEDMVAKGEFDEMERLAEIGAAVERAIDEYGVIDLEYFVFPALENSKELVMGYYPSGNEKSQIGILEWYENEVSND